MIRVKTGQICQQSGQYRPVGSTTEITLVEGKKFHLHQMDQPNS